ncbi:hypothetical protein NDU88_003223 [Pleurodeles waltl]|uniref:Secreted protein n=1 Tax=Pleurodeles waltl TaxID=8319 RepID=A0AAV7T548_PLEWA|nr:hypothetical protein NDU88_003223 [Pleurodeles waltl]
MRLGAVRGGPCLAISCGYLLCSDPELVPRLPWRWICGSFGLPDVYDPPAGGRDGSGAPEHPVAFGGGYLTCVPLSRGSDRDHGLGTASDDGEEWGPR